MKLSQGNVMEQYHIQFSHRFAALENLNDSEDMSRAWENIKDLITISTENNFYMKGSSIKHGFMKNMHSF
jgi:hypothetical protein